MIPELHGKMTEGTARPARDSDPRDGPPLSPEVLSPLEVSCDKRVVVVVAQPHSTLGALNLGWTSSGRSPSCRRVSWWVHWVFFRVGASGAVGLPLGLPDTRRHSLGWALCHVNRGDHE